MPMDREAEPGREAATEMDDALGSLEAELASFREPVAPAPAPCVSSEKLAREPADADGAEADDPRDAHFLIAAYRAC